MTMTTPTSTRALATMKKMRIMPSSSSSSWARPTRGGLPWKVLAILLLLPFFLVAPATNAMSPSSDYENYLGGDYNNDNGTPSLCVSSTPNPYHTLLPLDILRGDESTLRNRNCIDDNDNDNDSNGNATSNTNNNDDDDNNSRGNNFVLCINCHVLFDIHVTIHYNDDVLSAAASSPLEDHTHNHRQWFVSLHEIRHDTENENESMISPLMEGMLLPLDYIINHKNNNDSTEGGDGSGTSVIKVPVPYSILAEKEEDDADDDYYYRQIEDGPYHSHNHPTSSQRWTKRRRKREAIVMASLWREVEVENDDETTDSSSSFEGDIPTMDNHNQPKHPRRRRRHRIIVDRQLVHVMLPTATTSTNTDNTSTSSSRTTRMLLQQFFHHYHDPMYTVRLEDTVHFSKHDEMNEMNDEQEEKRATTNNKEWYRIASASLVGLLGGMIGLYAIAYTLPVREEEGVDLRTPSPTTSIRANDDYDMPQYTFEEHGMKGVRLFHNEDDEDSTGQHSSSSSSSSSLSPLVQNGVLIISDRHSECNTTNNATLSSARNGDDVNQSNDRLGRRSFSNSRTTGSSTRSSNQSTCSPRRLENDVTDDKISCTNVGVSKMAAALTTYVQNDSNKLLGVLSSSNASAEEMIHRAPLEGLLLLDLCERAREEIETKHSDTEMIANMQQSPQFSCTNEPDSDSDHRVIDGVMAEVEGGVVVNSMLGNIESISEEMAYHRQQALLVATDDTMQIGIVDEVRALNVAAVVDSRTQAEIPAECDPNDGKVACCEVQAGEMAKDSPSSPPNIVRIVLKEKTPNSPYFNPVVVAPSIVALSTDDVPSNATETLSPKENFLAPSVSSSAATAWIHNRSINSNPRHSMPPDNEVCNNGVSINCSKRQRQQSSMDASSASGLTTPLCSSNCSQCAPEVILPHLSREAENENHTTCPVSSVGQHDDASIASFGQDNDALLSPRSSELSNGQQQHMQCMQYVHLNNSLSPTSTVAATVHERTVTRKKMQACNGVGEDRPLPVPSGEAGQRKRFGLLTTHSLDFPDLAEQIEDSPSKEIDNKSMIHPRSKRKVRKIEKRLLATTRKPVVHIPSSTLISLSQRMEEPPSWQFSLK